MATIGNYAYVIKCRLAVASLRKIDAPLRLAHAVRYLGDAYYYARRASLAEPCYVEALSIYRRHEQRRPLDLANAIRGFAVLKDEVGAAEEAQRLWQEAHDLYVILNVPAGIPRNARRVAPLGRQRGEPYQSRQMAILRARKKQTKPQRICFPWNTAAL